MTDRRRGLLTGAGLALMGLASLGMGLWPRPGLATNPAHLCLQAAQQAAQRHGVPLEVLTTIALVETGRKQEGRMEPWPWATHANGRGDWFTHRDGALAHARATLAAGTRNIDLGCFQINYHWHGHQFASLEEMIDPGRNADYAARLLAQHMARLGSWERAAGAYHSATPQFAEAYLARFRQLRQMAGPGPIFAVPASVRENRFALLVPSGAGQMGSLVGFEGRRQGPSLIAQEGRAP